MHVLGVEDVPRNASHDQHCADDDPDQPGIVRAARALAVQAVEALQTLNALFTSVPGIRIALVSAVANTGSNTPEAYEVPVPEAHINNSIQIHHLLDNKNPIRGGSLRHIKPPYP